jgi:hypothetical protein
VYACAQSESARATSMNILTVDFSLCVVIHGVSSKSVCVCALVSVDGASGLKRINPSP